MHFLVLENDAMNEDKFIQLADSTGSLAVIAPELGGWLLRYARPTAKRGLVDALHFSQAVADRHPKEMWAGNPLLFPMVSFNHLPGREHGDFTGLRAGKRVGERRPRFEAV
ncbi:MAG: hypothetical protein EB141_17565, partial [Verrucomicrobia bacterium]|nr:hypothetical protein [Verrucomicrobiota bacterium]NDD37626.1 hypothetical protein [Verrucomicrobiota bacterium]